MEPSTKVKFEITMTGEIIIPDSWLNGQTAEEHVAALLKQNPRSWLTRTQKRNVLTGYSFNLETVPKAQSGTESEAHKAPDVEPVAKWVRRDGPAPEPLKGDALDRQLWEQCWQRIMHTPNLKQDHGAETMEDVIRLAQASYELRGGKFREELKAGTYVAEVAKALDQELWQQVLRDHGGFYAVAEYERLGGQFAKPVEVEGPNED